MLTDSTDDIGLRTGADPDEYLVRVRRVDDLVIVSAAILRYKCCELWIILELLTQILSYLLGCDDNDSPPFAEDLSDR